MFEQRKIQDMPNQFRRLLGKFYFEIYPPTKESIVSVVRNAAIWSLMDVDDLRVCKLYTGEILSQDDSLIAEVVDSFNMGFTIEGTVAVRNFLRIIDETLGEIVLNER